MHGCSRYKVEITTFSDNMKHKRRNFKNFDGYNDASTLDWLRASKANLLALESACPGLKLCLLPMNGEASVQSTGILY